MNVISGTIFDHNLSDDIYIFCVENNTTKYEIITKNYNWIFLCETNEPKITENETFFEIKNFESIFSLFHPNSELVTPRKKVLKLMKKSIKVNIIGFYFQSDHINSYTNCKNEGLTLLKIGGFLSYYNENKKKYISYYISPDFHLDFYKYKNGYIFSTINKIVEPFDKIEIEERNNNFTILTIPVDENITSTLKIFIDNENVDFKIGCTRTEDDGGKIKEFTRVDFCKKIEKNIKIMGNPTPNGFYKNVIYEQNF